MLMASDTYLEFDFAALLRPTLQLRRDMLPVERAVYSPSVCAL